MQERLQDIRKDIQRKNGFLKCKMFFHPCKHRYSIGIQNMYRKIDSIECRYCNIIFLLSFSQKILLCGFLVFLLLHKNSTYCFTV